MGICSRIRKNSGWPVRILANSATNAHSLRRSKFLSDNGALNPVSALETGFFHAQKLVSALETGLR